MLSLELKDLSGLGVDLSTLGFTSQELAAALTPGTLRTLWRRFAEVLQKPVM